jgi:2-isopropylmalate synthase
MRRIRIFDTTLRDGDQAAGFTFRPDEKIALARALEEAGADIIETGFPLASTLDREVCRLLARELAVPTAVMCRGRREDIAKTAEIFSGGRPGILHISLPVSKTHMEAKFGQGEKQILELAAETVSYAAGLVPVVELGAEDASRAGLGFLVDYCGTALEAGAKILNIADTLGILSPGEMGKLIAHLIQKVSSFSAGAVLSVHCHNDLGLAAANTLAAVEAGCSQVEVSVSGIGERAGNAALEEVFANLEARRETLGVAAGIRGEKVGALIALAAACTGVPGSPMKPLSGWNARAHSSGIHQQGLSRRRETYSLPLLEKMRLCPERIVLSRHSGQAGIQLFARRYCGIRLTKDQEARAAAMIKGAPWSVTGLSEFIAILVELEVLPSGYPGPLVIRSFSESLKDGGWSQDPQAAGQNCRVQVSLGFYGKEETEERCHLEGEGPSESAAVLLALAALPGPALFLEKTAVNGFGGRVRFYAEIKAGGRCYAVERTGAVPGRLFVECCLDAINAESLRDRGPSPFPEELHDSPDLPVPGEEQQQQPQGDVQRRAD